MSVTLSLGTSAGGIGTTTLTAVLSYTSTVLGSSGIQQNLPVFSNANSPMQSFPVSLTAGDNVVVIPTTAAWVTVTPPITSTNAKTWRHTGATGQSFHPAAGFTWAFTTTPPASMTINSVGSEVVQILFG